MIAADVRTRHLLQTFGEAVTGGGQWDTNPIRDICFSRNQPASDSRSRWNLALGLSVSERERGWGRVSGTSIRLRAEDDSVKRTIVLLAFIALVSACNTQRRGQLQERNPAHTPAQSARIFGDWILATSSDSTAFVGARIVELRLSPGSFALTAHYAGQPSLMITGEAFADPSGGPLTLTPRTNSRQQSGSTAPVMPVGIPVSVIATAADNSMLFASSGGESIRPTSVWHRKAAAKAAGQSVDPKVAKP